MKTPKLLNTENDGSITFMPPPTFNEWAVSLDEEDNLDLSSYNLIEVLEYVDKTKKRKGTKSCISCLVHNIRLIEEKYNITITPKRVNERFFELFQNFLSNEIEEPLLPSTIKIYCNTLIATLRYASRFNMSLSKSYDSFKMKDFRKEMIALTTDEISHIYHFDIKKNIGKSKTGREVRKDHIELLMRVRDMFVLSCNLGQRHSDMKRITPDCFNEDKSIFRITQQKTGRKAVVDIDKLSIDPKATKNILRKYNYSAPYKGAINKYNEILHELLKIIGEEFNETIKTEYKVLGEIRTINKPKHLAIASHTARRTFATLNVKKGLPEAIIRRGTGHADSGSFCGYIQFGEDK